MIFSTCYVFFKSNMIVARSLKTIQMSDINIQRWCDREKSAVANFQNFKKTQLINHIGIRT